jgi:hypothetical protein
MRSSTIVEIYETKIVSYMGSLSILPRSTIIANRKYVNTLQCALISGTPFGIIPGMIMEC